MGRELVQIRPYKYKLSGYVETGTHTVTLQEQRVPDTKSTTFSGTRAWWSAAVRDRSIVVAVVVNILAICLLLWQTHRSQTTLIESASLQQAEEFSASMAEVRTMYTSEVAARAGSQGIEVTHDYAVKDGAIPLPATFSKMLGERIADRGSGGYVKLYSDYPFPWRKDGGPTDAFQWEALIRLRENPDQPFSQIEELQGRSTLRYATADVMGESCVACHNSHPDSPKRDWNKGDVRGILEVGIPLDAAIAQANSSFRGIFIILLAFSTTGLLGVLAIVVRLRRKVAQARREAELLGQYKLEEKIGEGGMGEVYRASHAHLRRPTAVKLLRGDRASKQSIARFEREVQLTCQLTHPNTIAIYDFGHTPDGEFYYAMEYLDGLSLDRLVNEWGPLEEARVIHILRQVCASLEEAHRMGLVHRDIKPENIMLCQRGGRYDVVKVLDFGLVKQADSSHGVNVTAAHTITGTPLYMSPEQVNSPDQIDARSDLYQVGAVGYFLLTGTPVFEAESAMQICLAHTSTPPESPSARVGKTISRDLESLILQCLTKSKEERPDSGAEMIESLDGCEQAHGWSRQNAEQWWRLHGLETLPSSAAKDTQETHEETIQLPQHQQLGDGPQVMDTTDLPKKSE